MAIQPHPADLSARHHAEPPVDRALIDLLGDRFRCIAPDFPGYGPSPKVPESFAYDLDAQLAFVDAVS